jgi:acyl carrier protein
LERPVNVMPSGLEDILPLSPMQEGLFFHAVYEQEGVDVYTIQMGLELVGVLDAVRLRAACAAVIQRHAALRAAFVQTSSGRVVQILPRETGLDWQMVELGVAGGERGRRAELVDWLRGDQLRRFDLGRAPLVRFALVRLDTERHVLVVTAHHIVVDGWSMPLVFRDLMAFYTGRQAELPAPVSFRDFLAWLDGRDRKQAETAWRENLSGLTEPTLVAPYVESARAVMPRKVIVESSPVFARELAAAARGRGLTVSTVLQGAWALLLAQVTGNSDVVFGATVSGRPPELDGVENIVGLLINTIPVRVRISPAESLAQFLARIQKEQSELLDYQYLGLADIQRIAGMTNLFDTVLVYENFPLGVFADYGAGTVPQTAGMLGHDAFHYPLRLLAAADQGLHIRIDYRPDVIDLVSARHYARWVQSFAEAFVDGPDDTVDAFISPFTSAHPDKRSEKSCSPGCSAAGLAEETVMRTLFVELLNVSQVAPQDDFFALGGDSLAAVRLVGRIAAELGIVLPVQTVFTARTPADLAQQALQASCINT